MPSRFLITQFLVIDALDVVANRARFVTTIARAPITIELANVADKATFVIIKFDLVGVLRACHLVARDAISRTRIAQTASANVTCTPSLAMTVIAIPVTKPLDVIDGIT